MRRKLNKKRSQLKKNRLNSQWKNQINSPQHGENVNGIHVHGTTVRLQNMIEINHLVRLQTSKSELDQGFRE